MCVQVGGGEGTDIVVVEGGECGAELRVEVGQLAVTTRHAHHARTHPGPTAAAITSRRNQSADQRTRAWSNGHVTHVWTEAHRASHHAHISGKEASKSSLRKGTAGGSTHPCGVEGRRCGSRALVSRMGPTAFTSRLVRSAPSRASCEIG